MCLDRKKIYTTAHHIGKNINAPYQLSRPCGECSECRQSKANEWELRTYYEYLRNQEEGGYTIWDGLSYADEHHPHLNDIEKHVPDKLNFKCFNRKDIQDFWKRLRTNLKARGINPKGKLRYMIAAEYGQDENRTMRAHMHTIIYVNCDISPVEMSMEIKRAWGKGKTNGVEDKGYKYFWDKGVIQSKASALKVANYIGKYCLKNQEYDKVADAKIKELVKFWYSVEEAAEHDYNKIGDNIFKNAAWRKRKNDILRKVKTFHMQSQGYGKYALKCDCINEDGNLIGMPSTKKIYWWQKMPMYYVRKLYYDYKRIDGKIYWYLNENGQAWKIHNIARTIETTAKRIREKADLFMSEEGRQLILNYWEEEKNNRSDKEYYRLNDLAYAYRNGRRWEDYATYILFYQGRIHNGTILKPEDIIKLNAKHAVNAHAEYTTKVYHNYNTPNDKEALGHALISYVDLGDKERGYKDPTGTELTPRIFAERYTINENTLPIWENFDKLQDILDTMDFYLEWHKSRYLKAKRELQQLTSKGLLKLT